MKGKGVSSNPKEKSTPSKFLAPGLLRTVGKGRGCGRGIELGKFSAISRDVQSNAVIGKSTQNSSLSTKQRAGANFNLKNLNSALTKGHCFPAPLIGNAEIPGGCGLIRNANVTTRAKNMSTQSENRASISEIALPTCENEVNPSEQTPRDESIKNWKPRGRNKCQKVARLRAGNKLSVTFYNNRPVGDNRNEWSRHLGRLIRDSNIIRIRAHSWNDIEQRSKDHLWAAMKDKFSNDVIEDYKVSTLKHAQELWNKWRGKLHQTIKHKPISQQLKCKPNTIEQQADWEWLVKEYYHSAAFVGGKEGNHPDYASIYFEGHKKDMKISTTEAAQVHDKIVEVQSSEPSLTHVEVAERVHGQIRTRGYVAGYGGGVKPINVRGPYKTKNKLLDELKAKDQELKRMKEESEKKDKENDMYRNRLDKWDSILGKIVKNPVFQDIIIGEENEDGDGNDELHTSSSPIEDVC